MKYDVHSLRTLYCASGDYANLECDLEGGLDDNVFAGSAYHDMDGIIHQACSSGSVSSWGNLSDGRTSGV